MGKKKLKDRKKTAISSIYAMAGNCFGVRSYRGFAPLSVLSQMSMADEFNQRSNPDGTQRGLKKRHAKEAYEYARDHINDKDALWPEIILNIREPDVVKIKKQARTKGPKDAEIDMVKIQIFWDKIKSYKNAKKTAISRVDGNHRLYYAGGEIDSKRYPALQNVYSPFCIIKGTTVDDERWIFMTINYEQKKLNVSHLLRIKQQLSSDNEMWRSDKGLWIVTRLGTDQISPFYNEIFKGGRKVKGEKYLIRQKSLLDGVNQTLQNFVYHTKINDREKLLTIIINFYMAVEDLWPHEWRDKKKYMLMTSTGLQALGIVGGKLMTLLYPLGLLKKDDFKNKLIQLKQSVDDCWESKSEFMVGKRGRPGAQQIAEDIMNEIGTIDENDLEI